MLSNWLSARQRMIEVIKGHGFDDARIIGVMASLPREEFVPAKFKDIAYQDRPVGIGFGQTISQPFTVAFMTELLGLEGYERVLEIGTGSGYQTAILAKLSRKVYSVERIPELTKRAQKTLRNLNITNVYLKTVKREIGWEQEEPFDRILVTAGMEQPDANELLVQLNEGGIMVAPIGSGKDRVMTKFVKCEGDISSSQHGSFQFVPFVK